MKKRLLPFLLLFLSWKMQAQENIPGRIEQYEQEIAEGKVDETKMLKNYIDLITYYSHIDISKTHFYFHKAIAFAQEKKQLDWESAYWRRLGEAYCDLGKIDSAYYCIDRAIELVEDKGYDFEDCVNYQAKGVAFLKGSVYEKALDAYLKALEFNEKDKTKKIATQQDALNNFWVDASIFHNISKIYIKLLNYDKAIENLLHAKKITDENPSDRFVYVLFEIELLGDLAEVYLKTAQPDKALPLLNSCYELAVTAGYLPEMVNGLCRLSNFYCIERQDFNRALTFTQEALQIAEKTEMPHLIGYAERTMMKVYFGLKDYQTACRYAEQALLKIEKDDWDNLYDVYGRLIMIHALLGDISQSETYLKKYNEAVAKISDANLHNSLQEMEVKYDVQKKEFEIERQQAEINRQKNSQYVLLGGLLIAGLLLVMLVYIVTLRTRRNRELAEANATKDKFFSIISHDLKNPAIAQRDAIQLLLDYADQWDATSLSNYCRKLLKSANGQVDLLYTLLGWAQLQTGRMPFLPAQFDLTVILQPSIALIRNMADGKGVLFVVQMPETAIVMCDKNMIATVVRNLLTNAVKFTAKGGIVTLSLSPTSGSSQIRGCESKPSIKQPEYIVSIADTGTGMTSEQIESLFRLDRQHSHRGTAGEQGSGLGLIVCRELLQKHGSTLYVESEAGEGSCFWFQITV